MRLKAFSSDSDPRTKRTPYSVLFGTGSPESVVTASPGDLYVRQDGPNGSLWTKESGAGNTGWINLSTLSASLSISSFGSSANANGLTLAGNSLNMQPASNSFPGGVSTGPQTLAGNKTFSGTVTAASLIPTSATVPVNGMYLSAADSVGFSANAEIHGNFLGAGISSQWNFGTSTSGMFTFQNDGVSPVLQYNSSVLFDPILAPTLIYSGTNKESLIISGGVSSTKGAGLQLYGQAHATSPDLIEFFNTSGSVGSANASGGWIIGRSFDPPSPNDPFNIINGSLECSGTMGLGGEISSSVVVTVAGKNPLTTTTQVAVSATMVGTSSSTAGLEGVRSAITTSATSFNCAYLTQFYARRIALGLGSSVTRYINFYGDSSAIGTQSAFIADNLSFTGSFFINNSSSNPSSFSGYVMIRNQADPGAVVDGIRIGSQDTSPGNATLSLRTEAAVVTESVVSDRTLRVIINGVQYRICLKV